jgi:hypothetical protein
MEKLSARPINLTYRTSPRELPILRLAQDSSTLSYETHVLRGSTSAPGWQFAHARTAPQTGAGEGI